MKREFWKGWKRKTKLEEAGIKSVKIAKKIILKNIAKSKINSIYVKGSFIRRELVKKSDVDIVVIVNNNLYIKKVKILSKKVLGKYKPDIGISVHSLWELENNKYFIEPSKKLRGKPDLFVKKVKHYKLIFGKEIDSKKYPQRKNKKNLKSRIKTFRETFIPLCEKKKIGFDDLIKQVFWLVELEEDIKGNNPPDTWKKLDKSIKNKNHIMHLAYKYRITRTKDKTKRRRFIKRLETYLNRLESLK